MSKVVVIGAGWLGLPLAKQLSSRGHEVIVTKRKPEECEHFSEVQGLPAIPYQLGMAFPEELADAEIYIINIAPGRSTMEREQFVLDMQRLFTSCLQGKGHMLFVSTTSVYGERERTIIETSETEPLTESALAHVELENWLQQEAKKRSTIIRLAGLLGEDRNPVQHFAGKRDITAAHKVVNFVHREDVMAAIVAVIEKKHWGHVFHLCSTEHPTRLAYYKWAAQQLYLKEPHFMDESKQEPSGKLVDASNTINVLGVTLKYPSPYKMIPGASPPAPKAAEIPENPAEEASKPEA
ncbi:MAG: sugar nucleotide-binding protein [Aestuariibacter sp.]